MESRGLATNGRLKPQQQPREASQTARGWPARCQPRLPHAGILSPPWSRAARWGNRDDVGWLGSLLLRSTRITVALAGDSLETRLRLLDDAAGLLDDRARVVQQRVHVAGVAPLRLLLPALHALGLADLVDPVRQRLAHARGTVNRVVPHGSPSRGAPPGRPPPPC